MNLFTVAAVRPTDRGCFPVVFWLSNVSDDPYTEVVVSNFVGTCGHFSAMTIGEANQAVSSMTGFNHNDMALVTMPLEEAISRYEAWNKNNDERAEMAERAW